MVAGVITAAEFSNFEPKFIDEARFTLVAKTLMPQLFEKRRLPEHMGRTYNEPKHGTVTSTALTEGVPIAIGQIPTQGNLAITPAEAGLAIVLTDVALSSGRDDYAAQMGRVAGDATGKQIDQQGIARFANFQAVSATANNTMTVAGFSASVRLLARATEPPPKPWYAVFRPEPLGLVLNGIAPTGTYPVPDGISQEVLEQYYMHDLRVFGLNGGFGTTNVPLFTSAQATANCSTNAIFSNQASKFVEAHPVQFEKMRDIELRGWVMTVVSRHAYGDYLTSWGVNVMTDAAAPAFS